MDDEREKDNSKYKDKKEMTQARACPSDFATLSVTQAHLFLLKTHIYKLHFKKG